MKTIPDRKKTSRNLLAFNGGLQLPRPLAFLSHCTRPCHLRDMPKHHRNVAKWFPVITLPLIAAIVGCRFPGWIYMWTIAAALFAAAKWLTIFPLLVSTRKIPPARFLAYTFLWPGLNPTEFLFQRTEPTKKSCLVAFLKTFLGLALIILARHFKDSQHPILIGWTAMIGIVFLLHFGLFHLLALLWQTRPIMQFPIAATSLTQFWSGRWNRAFSDLTQRHIFRPLRRKLSAKAAILLSFLISGLLHETVITIPARGGYGLPTAYFLLQGLGHLAEHSAIGQQLGLGDGWKGWTFVALVAGAPVVALFPPIFIQNVIIPMLEAL